MAQNEGKDRYSHIARAWDGKKWWSRLETDEAGAMRDGFDFQDLVVRDEACNDHLPFLLIEVAETNARGTIIAQWVGTPDGYKRVSGR